MDAATPPPVGSVRHGRKRGRPTNSALPRLRGRQPLPARLGVPRDNGMSAGRVPRSAMGRPRPRRGDGDHLPPSHDRRPRAADQGATEDPSAATWSASTRAPWGCTPAAPPPCEPPPEAGRSGTEQPGQRIKRSTRSGRSARLSLTRAMNSSVKAGTSVWSQSIRPPGGWGSYSMASCTRREISAFVKRSVR